MRTRRFSFWIPMRAVATTLALVWAWVFWAPGTRAFAQDLRNPVGTTLDLRRDCGAKGDGEADDAAALRVCLEKLMVAGPAPREGVLRVPGGIYRISGAEGAMPALGGGVTLRGEGSNASVFVLDKTYSGPLFSWSEAWMRREYRDDALDVAQDRSGPTITDLKIVGSRQAETQTGIAFYDRNDFALMRDVDIEYIPGPCISMGKTLSAPIAYVRESTFFNVRCFFSGTRDEPAIEIASYTRQGSDATNQLDFFKLAVFRAQGAGVVIRNPNDFSATRAIRIFGLRVEHSGADGVDIGYEGDRGQVAAVDIYNLTAVNNAGAALRIGALSAARTPYDIAVHGGMLGPGNTIGVEIDNGRAIDIELGNVQSPNVLGPRAGDHIAIHGNGSEYSWRFDNAPGPARGLGPRFPFGLYGLPNADEFVGAAALKGEAQSRPAQLTMDGKAPDAHNCFNPGRERTLSLNVRLIASPRGGADGYFAWSVPLAVLQTRGQEVALQSGPPQTLSTGTGAAASAALAADAQNGCVMLTFTPPSNDARIWEVAAFIQFTMAP